MDDAAQYPDLLIEALRYFRVSNPDSSQNDSLGDRTVLEFVNARTVLEFVNHYKKNLHPELPVPQPQAVDVLLKKLCDLRFLSPAGVRAGAKNIACTRNTYLGAFQQSSSFSDRETQRYLNCAVFGFLRVYEEYRNSVRYITNSRDGFSAIGTCFVIDDQTLLTARHCVDRAERIEIEGIPEELLLQSSVFFPRDDDFDLAVIRFESRCLFEVAPIRLAKPRILLDVIAMGYPNLAGLVPTLAVEKAQISGTFTASRGAIVSKPMSYLARRELLLITARVRGGFSGCPLLNSFGECVGVVVGGDMPADPTAIQNYDNLGYGLALNAEHILQVIKDIDSGSLSRSGSLPL